MKKLFILLLFISFFFLSCHDTSEFQIGYTTPGFPVSIALNSSGTVGLYVGSRWVSPIGVFSIRQNIPERYISTHRTKIIIKETTKDKKYVYELLEGESFNYTDKYRTYLNIEEANNSTIISIESDEIDQFLKVARVKDPKPDFPQSPCPYFFLTKKLNVDWSVNSVSDFLLNIIYCVFYFLAIVADLFIIAILFILRLIYFLIMSIIYIIGSMLD